MAHYSRLICTFHAKSFAFLPAPHVDEVDLCHPFWQAIHSEAIATDARALGLEPLQDFFEHVFYAADWIRDIYFNLPLDEQLRKAWLECLLRRLSFARKAAPNVIWQRLELDGMPLSWDESTRAFAVAPPPPS